MSKKILLLAASVAMAGVPVQFSAGSAAKADEVNKNFAYLDSAKATIASIDLLTSAVNAKAEKSLVSALSATVGSKADTSELSKLKSSVPTNASFGAKADSNWVNNKLTGKADAASITNLSTRQDSLVKAVGKLPTSSTDADAKRRIDSLAATTKTSGDSLGKRVTALEGKPITGDWSGITGKPSLITNDTAGIRNWTTSQWPGAVVAAGIISQGPSDLGAAAFVRREPGSGSSVLDFHTDGVINSWGTEGGIQTNSVTRIDGNGNGQLQTLSINGSNPNGVALSVHGTGDNWTEGIEVTPSRNDWGGLFLRGNSTDKTGTWGVLRTNTGSFAIGYIGLNTMPVNPGTGWAASPFSIDTTGNAAFGGHLTVYGKLHTPGGLAATTATITDLRVAGSLVTNPTTPWADYVFEPGYKTMPLKDIEAFAKANGHLPEVPSAAEVAKDGIDLARMNAILLKKVEELTLHAVEQEKRMEALTAKVEAMQAGRQ